MNKTQIEYAMKRIDDLLKAKEEAVTKDHKRPAQKISDEERARLLRAGVVQLRDDVNAVSRYTDVVDVFDFSAHCWPESVDTEAVDRTMAPLRLEALRLKDKIMLGDATAAQSALEQFSEKVRVDG